MTSSTAQEYQVYHNFLQDYLNHSVGYRLPICFFCKQRDVGKCGEMCVECNPNCKCSPRPDLSDCTLSSDGMLKFCPNCGKVAYEKL